MEFTLICILAAIVVGFTSVSYFLFCEHEKIDSLKKSHSSDIQFLTKTVKKMHNIQQSEIRIMMSPYLNSLGIPDERFCVPIKQNELFKYENNLIVVKDVREHRLLVGVSSGEHTIIPAAVYGEYGQWTRKYLAVSEPYLIQTFDHIYALIPPKQ